MAEGTSEFCGWAVVELFGHQKEVGFVTTQYFGTACLFRIDVPDIVPREETTDRPRWVEGKLLPAGSVVKADGVPGRTRLVGPSAVYALNPCDEQTARLAAERNLSRDIKIVSIAEGRQLLPGEDEPEDQEYGV